MLTGRVALITGGASGIGAAIATRFVHEGAQVLIVDRDTTKGLAFAKTSGKLNFFEADLQDAGAIPDIVEYCIATFDRLDILVNSAGIILPKNIADIQVNEWDLLMAINLRAPFLLSQAALPALEATRGTILNIASTAALRVFRDNIPYIASKSGLISMTKAMALDLHSTGIRVNCICPGAVDTPLLNEDIDRRGLSRSDLPESLLIQPAQIASTALHIVSDAGQALNGSVIVIDTGALLL